MGKCVSHYSHSSFFIVKIWVDIEVMWIKRHIVLFMATNFELWANIEIMWIKRHIVFFLYIATNLKYGYTREYFLCIPIFDNL